MNSPPVDVEVQGSVLETKEVSEKVQDVSTGFNVTRITELSSERPLTAYESDMHLPENRCSPSVSNISNENRGEPTPLTLTPASPPSPQNPPHTIELEEQMRIEKSNDLNIEDVQNYCAMNNCETAEPCNADIERMDTVSECLTRNMSSDFHETRDLSSDKSLSESEDIDPPACFGLFGDHEVTDRESLLGVDSSLKVNHLNSESKSAIKTVRESDDVLESKGVDEILTLELSTKTGNEVDGICSLNSYRAAVVPYSDSDDSDSSTSSSCTSDSSDSSDESSEVDLEEDQESTGPDRKSNQSLKPVKAKGEIDVEDLPPIQDLQISVRNDQVVEIGKVLHIVDALVVVECYKDQPPLDIESVLFLDEGARSLGRVYDVMGPVTEPLYCVRFNSKKHIDENNVRPGMLVYCAPQTEHSHFVFVKKLIMMKGSDASWKSDQEVPASFVDFSDDEEESARVKQEGNDKEPVQQECAGEPSRKVRKNGPRQNNTNRLPGATRQVSQHGNRGRGGYARNPWSWSGARHNFSSNSPEHSRTPHQSNRFCSPGHIMPPSFTAGPRFSSSRQELAVPQAPRHHRHSQNSHFGRMPDPQNFSQGPSFAWGSRPGFSNRGHMQYQNQRGSFNHQTNSFRTSDQINLAAPSHESQRYHAFQSEIARLVDAYNSGADSPASTSHPFRHPPHPNDTNPFYHH